MSEAANKNGIVTAGRRDGRQAWQRSRLPSYAPIFFMESINAMIAGRNQQ
jgi:hypothetical protein